MAFFSIITVNRNNAAGLQATIESVLSQSFSDFEYIVIDGASSDGSVEIIREHESRLSFWVSEPDTGIYNAMNKGIAKSKGRYCLFLNSGDCFESNSVLAKVFASSPAESFVYGNLIFRQANGIFRKSSMPSRLTWLFFFRESLCHPATFIRPDVFSTFGFYDEQYKVAADYAFFLKAIMKGKASYRLINVTVSVFDQTGMSMQPANRKLIESERRKAQKTYFNPLTLAVCRLLWFFLPFFAMLCPSRFQYVRRRNGAALYDGATPEAPKSC